MSKFDAAYTNKLYGLGETIDHDEAIEHDLRSHLEGYLKWRPIDEEDTPERYFDAFVSMLGRVKPELAAVADRSEFLWDVIEDKVSEAGMSPKIESIEPSKGWSTHIDDDEYAKLVRQRQANAAKLDAGRGSGDIDPRMAQVGDFEKELIDLYWAVVDSGVDEGLAGDWFDGVRKGLDELLRR